MVWVKKNEIYTIRYLMIDGQTCSSSRLALVEAPNLQEAIKTVEMHENSFHAKAVELKVTEARWIEGCTFLQAAIDSNGQASEQ